MNADDLTYIGLDVLFVIVASHEKAHSVRKMWRAYF